MGLTDEQLKLISDFTVFGWVEERAKVVAAMRRYRPENMSQACHELEGIFAEFARALAELKMTEAHLEDAAKLICHYEGVEITDEDEI